MKRRKLKKYVIPTAITSFVIVGMLVASMFIQKSNNNLEPQNDYVPESITNDDQSVIKTIDKVLNPFTDQSVTIGKKYYNYKGTTEDQEKSIIYHDETYLQNSGVDYVNEKEFEVVSILDGTVTNIKEDEVLGKVIEIKHNNNYVSSYQSLNKINVKKGDNVTAGQVIGTSGTNELDKDLGNHLHFELYIDGKVVNPEDYLNKELNNAEKQQ